MTKKAIDKKTAHLDRANTDSMRKIENMLRKVEVKR
jgi:hypothetical protein